MPTSAKPSPEPADEEGVEKLRDFFSGIRKHWHDEDARVALESLTEIVKGLET